MLVEPSAMFDILQEKIGTRRGQRSVRILKGIFSGLCDEISNLRPDSIIYNNVLEHIEDDVQELRLLMDVLDVGGRVLIFVPAGRYLFSDFDRHIGHFRRYSRRELVDKVKGVGFRVLDVRNVDSLGVLPWLVKYRLLGSTTIEPGMVRLYDTVAVPLLRRLEGAVPPPFGKNLLVVAEKNL